jgi:hypothetical protein
MVGVITSDFYHELATIRMLFLELNVTNNSMINRNEI